MYHSSAITSTGELYTGGANDEGQVLPSEAASNHGHNKQGDLLLSLTCVEIIFDLLQLL
jgi:alpha-tubulin suppressor-like RCC1 family protein